MHGIGHGESLWTSSGALPQSVTIDLGKSYDSIDMLEYLPQRHTGTTAGNITSYTVQARSAPEVRPARPRELGAARAAGPPGR